MLLKERLEAASPEEGARLVNRIISEGEDTEFGDWVRLCLDQNEEGVVGAIKGMGISPGINVSEAALIATGRLQAVELLKAQIFSRMEVEEEVDDE
jgi:hypothetical protein